ncbi:MAG: NADH-quinone oxidoreductase subunit H [Cytophagales bacterium]|nr:NADH-quinone oxidoreductase subunit H [Cytophagales bacterium]
MSTFFFYLPFLLLFVLFAVYAERKLSAFIQDRLGPMETGYKGLAQTTADLLKLLQKEAIIPQAADRSLFVLAPILIFTAVFAGFAVLPVTSAWSGAQAATGLLYLLAVVSLEVIGVLLAGWASNNKYALFGAMRAIAQIISYEIPLGLSVLCVVIITQTLDLQAISFQQGIWINSYPDAHERSIYLFGLKTFDIEVTQWGGIFTWNIFQVPFFLFVYIIFFIASLAECNRAPFDLPEAESEIIGGYHTEYTGFRWALMMLAEYGMMLLVSILGVILFWGSWNTPLPNIGSLKLATWTSGQPGTLCGNLWAGCWLFSKTLLILFLQIWIRWTYPRLRVDQLMNLSWKCLTPAALVLLLLTTLWKFFLS